MNHRPDISILAVILLVFTLLIGCSPSEEQAAVMVPFFPDSSGADLSRFSFTDGTTILRFNRVDCVWVVGDQSRPADEPRVAALAEALASLAPQLEPAIGPERFADFRVADDNYTLKAVLNFKNAGAFTLLIGTPALTKPAYIRAINASRVYSADEPLFRQLSLDSSDWLAPAEG